MPIGEMDRQRAVVLQFQLFTFFRFSPLPTSLLLKYAVFFIAGCTSRTHPRFCLYFTYMGLLLVAGGTPSCL